MITKLIALWFLLIPSIALAGPPSAPQAGGTGIAADGSVPFTDEITVDQNGIEFQETDTITDCTGFAATGGGIFYDDSEGALKKCQDNVLTVLDTGGTPSDTVYGAGWNGDTTNAASKNAIYDKVELHEADTSSVHGLTNTDNVVEAAANVTDDAVVCGDGGAKGVKDCTSITIGNIDAGAGDLEIPNSATPTTDTTGQVALDTTITDHLPLIQYYNGANNMSVISVLTSELPATEDQILKYDAGTDTFLLEADAGGGSGAFDDTTDPVDLVTTTKDVVIGTGAVNTSKLTIDGDADQVQLTVQGNGTQTDSVFIVEASGGTEVFSMEDDGSVLSVAGATWDFATATVDLGDATVTLPPPSGTWDFGTSTVDLGDTTLTLPPLSANEIASTEIATIVESIAWNAGGITTDGTQCAAASKSANTLVPVYTIVCADNDGSDIYGVVTMPDSWDGGTVTFELTIGQIGASTQVVDMDFAARAIGTDEALTAFGATPTGEQQATVTMTADNDILTATTSAVTVNCPTSCAGGDTLFWTGQVDATASGAEIATAMEIIGVKMEYTSNVGD